MSNQVEATDEKGLGQDVKGGLLVKRLERLRAIDKFNGNVEQWYNWKFKYWTEVNGHGFGHFFQRDTHLFDEMLVVKGVHAHLISCLADSVLPLIMHLETWKVAGEKDESGEAVQCDAGCPHPYHCWKILLDTYERNTAVHKRLLRLKLTQVRMTTDFRNYVAEIDHIVSQLAAMNVRVESEEKLGILLSGLPSSAAPACTVIDTDLKYSKDYVMACDYLRSYFDRQEASSSSSKRIEAVGTSVFQVVAGVNKRWSDKQRQSLRRGKIICRYCKRSGHIEKNCWKKTGDSKPGDSGSHNGSSDRWQDSKSMRSVIGHAGGHNSVATRMFKCFRCHQVGHKASDCWQKDRKDGNMKQSSSSAVGHVDALSCHVVAGKCGFVNISSDDRLNNANGSSRVPYSFIIDSGAEMHVCNDITLFTELSRLSEPLLLRGFQDHVEPMEITHVGTVLIIVAVGGEKRGVMLQHCAYVPGARVNLVSASRVLQRGYNHRTIRVPGSQDWKWVVTDERDGRVILTATLVRNKFVVDVTSHESWPRHSSCQVAAPVQVQGVSDVMHMAGPQERKVVSSSVSEADVDGCVSNNVSVNVLNASKRSGEATLSVWHQRLGHLNEQSLRQYVARGGDDGIVIGLRVSRDSARGTGDASVGNCAACHLGKSRKLPFPAHSMTRAARVMERVHTDICGPMQVPSLGGHRYFAVFVDDMSRRVQVEFLKFKSELFDKFREYHQFWTNHFGGGCQIRFIRMDGSGENLSSEMTSYCMSKGIKREITVPHSPSQDGVSERVIGTLVQRARCMMEHAGMPTEFWANAIYAAADVFNNTPTSANEGRPPNLLWNGVKPDVSMFRVFGCEAFAHRVDANKLEAQSVRCVCLFRDGERKGYRLWDLVNKKVIISRDVVFNETVFPFKVSLDVPCASTQPASDVDASREIVISGSDGASRSNVNLDISAEPQLINDSDSEMDVKHVGELDGGEVKVDGSSTSSLSTQSSTSSSTASHSVGASSKSVASSAYSSTDSSSAVESSSSSSLSSGAGASAAAVPSTVLRRSTRSNIGARPPRFSPNDGVMVELDAVSLASDPTDVDQALSSDERVQWQQAMDAEVNAMKVNQVWDLVMRQSDVVPIKAKWVFKRKRKADGSIERYKARLVAKGYTQMPGIDFDDTFAPVAQSKSLRILLALAAQFNLNIHQWDVVSAFLNGSIDRDLYMEQPVGYDDGSGRVCKLRKAIYGLKQASRCWNQELNDALINIGFKQCVTDPCVYVKRVSNLKSTSFVYLGIHVDDMVVVDNDHVLRADVLTKLNMKFEILDKGVLEFMIGWHVQRDRCAGTLSVDQNGYVSSVIERFRMTNCNSLSTPASYNIQSDSSDHDGVNDVVDEHMYKSLVGSLLYAANGTRPDILYATNVVCRYMSKPDPVHWRAAKRIVRYLQGSKQCCLRYSQYELNSSSRARGSSVQVIGYSDSSWADAGDRRATSGYVFLLAGGPVSWSCRRQTTVALSSVEAEYMELTNAAQEAIWICNFMSEIGYGVAPITVYSDSQGAIALAQNNIIHARSKHIEVKEHFIRDCVSRGYVNLEWVGSGAMLADIFTKPLPPKLFSGHRDCIVHL